MTHHSVVSSPCEGGGTNPSSIDFVVESTGADLVHTAQPSASIKGFDNSDSKTISDVNSDLLGSITTQGPIDDGGATPIDEINTSEGEDLNVYDLHMLLQPDKRYPGHSSIGEPQTYRKSSRKSIMPSKLNDYVVDIKVKYGLNKYVNYSNLSSDNYSFVTNLNKTYEPKSYKEAATDPRWVDAMNSEMEALNRNKTWIITDLPSGRKAIGSK
ncbi:ribonuclease H-like domain-containing protein [Tanacetum coccineum]